MQENDITGQYITINEKKLDAFKKGDLKTLFNDNFFETAHHILIEKILHELHHLLTETTTFNLIKGNKLSESLLGIHQVDYSKYGEKHLDGEFAGWTTHEELPEIITVLEKIDWEKLKTNTTREGFEEKNIILMKKSIDDLLTFYKKALNTNHHVITLTYY